MSDRKVPCPACNRSWPGQGGRHFGPACPALKSCCTEAAASATLPAGRTAVSPCPACGRGWPGENNLIFGECELKEQCCTADIFEIARTLSAFDLTPLNGEIAEETIGPLPLTQPRGPREVEPWETRLRPEVLREIEDSGIPIEVVSGFIKFMEAKIKPAHDALRAEAGLKPDPPMYPNEGKPDEQTES